MSISGYLSIYNDWDLLAPALAAVAPLLDELVVVDGGYGWMAAFQQQIGRDPAKSGPQVYDALAGVGIPVRVIAGTWSNEIEKRIAGFRACAGRFVLRIDADEILYFDKPALEQFQRSGHAVAEMEMPTYVAPGWIEGSADGSPLPRQAVLFDREQISAEAHLHYLWLILTKDALPAAPHRLAVFATPIAFNAHLTHWRTPDTAIQRACFYALNWSRKFGVPWIPELAGRPLDDVATLLKFVSASEYFDIMLGHPLVAGNFDLGGRSLVRTKLDAAREQPLLPLWRRFVAAQGRLNRQLGERPRRFMSGLPICLDFSDGAAIAPLTFEVSQTVAAAKAVLHSVMPQAPWQRAEPLTATIEAGTVRVQPEFDAGAIRRVLELTLWTETSGGLPSLRLE